MQHGWYGAMDVEIARDRYAILLREAEVDRMMRQLRGESDPRRPRLSQKLGDLLIALGCRLKRVPVSKVFALTGSDPTMSSNQERNGASTPGAFF